MSVMFHKAGEMMPTLEFLGRAILFFFTSALLLASIWMLSESENKNVKCRKRLDLARFSGLFMAFFVIFAFFAEAEMFAHNGTDPYCPFKGCGYLLLWGILYFVPQLLRSSNDYCRTTVGLSWIIVALILVIATIFIGRGRYGALKTEQVEQSQTYTYLARTKNEDGSYTLLMNVGSDGSILVYERSTEGKLKPLVFAADELEFRKDYADSSVAVLVESNIVELRYIPYNNTAKPVKKKVETRKYIRVGDYSQIASGLQSVVLGPEIPDNVVFGPQAPNR